MGYRNMMDTKLLEILVCPLCKGGLQYDARKGELKCNVDKLAYPIREGIPVMMEQEARSLTEESK